MIAKEGLTVLIHLVRVLEVASASLSLLLRGGLQQIHRPAILLAR